MKEINVMLDERAIEPRRAHLDDAGLDLYTPYRIVLYPGDYESIDTGVHVEIPEGFCAYTKSRSGLVFKSQIQVISGTIDAGYTGSIGLMLHNFGHNMRIIEAGERIGQLVIHPIVTPRVNIVNRFLETERGSNGFGSTGR